MMHIDAGLEQKMAAYAGRDERQSAMTGVDSLPVCRLTRKTMRAFDAPLMGF